MCVATSTTSYACITQLSIPRDRKSKAYKSRHCSPSSLLVTVQHKCLLYYYRVITMSVKRRIKNRDIQRTWSLQGDPSQRRVKRRNTTIPEAVPQPSPLFDTPPYSPKTPPSEGPDLGPRFNFFHKRRASVPASMLAGRPGSTKSALGLGVSSGSLNRTGTNGKGFPNGRSSPQRSRHLSTGSSVHSDEHETSLSTAASSTNFFDFDENSDDIYLVQPEEHVNNMRKEHKKRERYIECVLLV